MEESKQHNNLPVKATPAYRIVYLVAGFTRRSLTEEEHDELDEWVNDSDSNMQLFEELTDDEHLAANMEWMDSVLKNQQ